MKLLALDTSTEACSVALLLDGAVTASYQLAPRQHTQLILPMIDNILAKAQLTLNQLDAIAFARGPGSFTGLRIAAGVVQGLAFALDLPVLPVSTLAVMAQTAYAKHHAQNVIVCLDARMQEVYVGNFKFNKRSKLMEVIKTESVCAPQLAPLPEQNDPELPNYWGIGDGWASYGECLQQRYKPLISHTVSDLRPLAQFILPFAQADWLKGKSVSAEQAVPVYLREQVVAKSA